MDDKTDLKDESLKRIFESDHLTLEMAISYLFQHRTQTTLIPLILNSIQKFSKNQLQAWVPMIVYIFSESGSPLIEQFLHKLSSQSIPMYLIIRWCLGTFIPSFKSQSEALQILRNKLDTKFINSLSEPNQTIEITAQIINDIMARKVALSNYINVLNKFYQKLFRMPEKLKNIPENQRKEVLHQKLQHLIQKFISHQETQYCSGICFPLCPSNESYLLMDFKKEACITFSTRQRIPFRIIFQTINFQDYDRCKMEDDEQNMVVEDNLESNLSSFVLPHTYFGQNWNTSIVKLTKNSPYRYLPSYRIHAYMIKSGDDFRQEYLAMLLLRMLKNVFEEEHLKLWVKCYRIIPFSAQSGLIQFLNGTHTISHLKAKSGQKSLRVIYKQIFGDKWQTAVMNFINSLAGYSLFQYIFEVKDRHNNNILIDEQGYAIHIDFSFIIGRSPGNLSFQKAPFKFTEDYMEMMEGVQSDLIKHFEFLLASGLKFLRKYKKQILGVLSIMSNCPGMKCFSNFDIVQIQKRFHENFTDEQLKTLARDLVKQSYNSYSTSNYDRYQWLVNEIHS